MFRTFTGSSADEVWRAAAVAMSADTTCGDVDTRLGRACDLGRVAFVVTDSRNRWVASRTPAINPAFAVAEIVWIVRGRNDAAFLNFFNSKLPQYAGNDETYHGAYGFRLRRHFGVDQLERAYEALRANPQTRQVVLQFWDCRNDLPFSDGSPQSSDIPCNVISLLKVRGPLLEWTQIMRSNDLFRGTPYNIIQFTSLQEILAGWIGKDPGNFHLITDSLHAYQADMPKIRDLRPQSAQEPGESLSLPKDESDSAFERLEAAIERMIDHSVSSRVILESALERKLPQAFANLLFLLSAEALRRRRERKLANKIMANCTSAPLQELWKRWERRTSQKIRDAKGKQA
jgi:thymidylate synthase